MIGVGLVRRKAEPADASFGGEFLARLDRLPADQKLGLKRAGDAHIRKARPGQPWGERDHPLRQRPDHVKCGKDIAVPHLILVHPVDPEERNVAASDDRQAFGRKQTSHLLSSPISALAAHRLHLGRSLAPQVAIFVSRLRRACADCIVDERFRFRAGLALAALATVAMVTGALAVAALLLFALAFLSLIVPSLVAISEDAHRTTRDFRFNATRLRLGLPIMGDF